MSVSCVADYMVQDECCGVRREREREGMSAGADIKQTLWSRFEYFAAYPSDCRVELPLRPSASAAPPFGPRLLLKSLWAHKGVCFSVSGR